MEEQLREILAAHGKLATDAWSVESGADLYKLGLTSHASVNVMLAVEDEFDVEFPDADLTKSTFQTLGSLADVVGRLSDQT